MEPTYGTDKSMPGQDLVAGPIQSPSQQPLEKTPSSRPAEDIEQVPVGEEKAGNPREIKGFRWVLVCASLYLSILMYGLDVTIAADIQASVVETFESVDQLAWLGIGFSLGSVATILPYGALYTSFNMKWLYISGIILFEAGSALCGGAPTMDALIVGRVIAGIGGTGVYLGGLTYVPMLTTPKERGGYIAGIAFVWGLGCVLGPVVGGGLSDSSATWRWAFYLNLVLGAITAPVYLFYLPAIRPQRDIPFASRLSRLDWVGFVLSAGAWVAFSIGFTNGGTQWAWSEGRTIATLVVFGMAIIAYVLQQYFCIFTTPSTRSFPCHLLRSRTIVLLFVATACGGGGGLPISVYYTPVYFQFVESDTAIMAAVRLLPFLLVLIAVSLASGFLLHKIQYYMPLYVAAGVLMTLGGALLYANLDPSTPTSRIYGFNILVAVGTGLCMQTGYSISSLKVSPEDIGPAMSIQNMSQLGSTFIALVIAGQVFQSVALRKLNEVLAGEGFAPAEIQSVVAGAQSKLFEDLSGELRDRAVLAVAEAIQRVFILLVTAGALLTAAGLLMKRERLLFKDIST